MKPLPNLRHLRYLVALADQRSFRRAAAECAVSQSTLSAGIRELEIRLGFAVAERTTQSVLITPAGARVADRARLLLREAEALMENGAGDPGQGRIELGVIPSVGPFLLPRFLPHARNRSPGLVFGLREEKTPSLLERLGDGRLDLVLMAFPYDTGSFEAMPLFDDVYRFACHPEHPLAARSTIAAADLADEPLLLMERDNCLHRTALPILTDLPARANTAFAATSLHMLVAMVAEGLGATFLPELAISAGLLTEHRIITRPLADPANRRTIGLVWRRSSDRAGTFRSVGAMITGWMRDRAFAS